MIKDDSHIRLGLRVKKSKQNPFGWQPVERIPADSACILALPGSDTDSSRKANGFCKLITSMLDDMSFPVYCTEYEKGSRNFRHDREAVLAEHGQENPAYARHFQITESEKNETPHYISELYEKVFAPRLRDEAGNKTSLSVICRRLNQIIPIGHCQGSTVAFSLEKLLIKDMTALGYSDKVQTHLLKQLHIINVAPTTPLGATQTTTFKFASFSDDMVTNVHTPQTTYIRQRKAEHERFIEGLSGNETERRAGNRPFSMDFSIFRPSQTEIVFAVNNMYPLQTQKEEEFDGIEHTFDTYSEKEDYIEKDDGYIDRTKQGDQLSTTLRSITNWLVEHAKQNTKEYTELPDIFTVSKLRPLLERAQTNRYNFITNEIRLCRTRKSR